MRVLGVSGSLRAHSYNRGLLRAAQQVAPEGMTIELHDLAALPLYDGDVEAAGDPAPVKAWKDALRAADAVLLSTPEYNYSTSGVLKNALDWASRPLLQTPLSDKPVALMGVGGGQGNTALAQMHLRQVLTATNSHVMRRPGLLVNAGRDKFDASGNLVDDRTREALVKLLQGLAAWKARLG
ncbi:MAG: NAD(P)H-dependent oxidoreductase [Deltaproteobacteria bacterium]|nr:NAD(P)H-dependent oxidoreductase [Deltaproteobacteria bacterium]